MRRKARNILKIAVLFSCFSIVFYYFKLYKHVEQSDGNRNRPDAFDYYGHRDVNQVNVIQVKGI